MASSRVARSSQSTWPAAVVLALLGALLPAVGAHAEPDTSADRAAAELPCTVTGTAGDDVLVGGRGDDVLCGGGGDDVLRGGPGDDVLRGGGGEDRLFGGPGDDYLQGGRADDRLRAGAGDDDLRGGRGDDRLHARDAARFRDDLRCAEGREDRAYADRGDVVSRTCELPDRNAAPTDLTLSPTTVAENVAVGTEVGMLSVTDPDRRDAHTFAVVPGAGDADNASFSVSGLRLLTAAAIDFERDASLSVRLRVTDRTGATYDEAVTVTVLDVAENRAPVAVDDTFATIEDTLLELPVSGPGSPVANDTDSDALTVTAVGAASGGTVALVGATIRFTPAVDRCGMAAGGFDYTVSDGRGGTDVGRVGVDITCVPDDPRASDDSATLVEDDAATALPVLANDTDVEGDALVIGSVTQPDHGTVVVTGAGSGLTYEPDAGYCTTGAGGTPDTFAYRLAPGGSTATVSVTITCVDDAPVAVDDTRMVVEDSGATAIDVLGNDTDVDAGELSVRSVTQPDDGTVVITGSGTGLTYAPDADFCTTGGSTDDFTYTLSGGSTAMVSVTVTCVDDAPVAVDDARTVGEDSGATAVAPLGNDTDVDGGPKTVVSVTQPADGTVVITGGGTGLTYSPDANFCTTGGSTDDFTYTLNGGATATVSVTVTCVDDAPVAVDDARTVGEDSGATAVAPLGNDTDVDGGPKTVVSVTQPADGTVAITGGGTGVTYAPDADFCTTGGSTDTFTYTLDGGSTATVSVTVTCVDDAPVAVADSATVLVDAPATAIGVLGNDTDVDGGPKTVASVTQPANGTVVITGGGTGLTYRPTAGYCNSDPGGAPDTFTYTLNGGSIATVSITVTCDVPPVAVDDTATVLEDSGASAIDVLANDTNPDGGPKRVASVTQPADGTVVVTGGGTGLTYAPDLDYCSASGPADTFTYQLNGGSSATVSVTVTCDNDAPVAVDDARTVVEDSSASAVDVLGNDTDVDGGPKSVASVIQPANGTVVITGGGTGVTYVPDADYCNAPGGGVPDAAPDTFTYTLNGGSTGTVRVTVTCVDDRPVAVADSATTAEDTAVDVDVLGNETDVDGGPRSVASVTQPADGTVTITGGGTGVRYTPAANFCSSAADTFTYVVNGGTSATVSVTVTCVDDDPVAVADSATVRVDAPATAIDVLVNDTDVDGGPKTVASVTQPANGTVVITGGGTGVTYEPAAGYCNSDPGGAPDTFTYTLNGGGSATVSMTVTCDVPPVAVDDAATVQEDAAASAIDVLANDTNPDGGPKRVVSVSDPANGTTTFSDTGVTYAPDADYCTTGGAVDTFTYAVNGGATATVSVTVTCVDDAPVAVADARTVLEDSGATAVAPLGNDTDVDAGPRSILSVTQPANGTVVITGGGTELTYAPKTNFCTAPGAVDTFTYTLNGGSTATVRMTVTCVNDVPVADDEAVTGAIGNTTLIGNDPTDPAPTVTHISRTVTADLLDGDVDVDGPGPLVVTAGTFLTNDGGSVVLEADGDFVYTPAAATSCTDTSDFFDYTVSDGAAVPATDTGRVTITLTDCVWYVSNTADGVGTSRAPFKTLLQAQAASAASHTIYLFDGDDTTTGYSAGFDLKAGQRLLGEAAELQVAGALLRGATSSARPTITDATGSADTDVITLAAGTTVRGIQVDPQGNGGGISGIGAGVSGGTIHDVRIVDTGTAGTQPGLELDGTTGTWAISGLVVQNGGSATATGIRLNNAGTVNLGTGVGANTVSTSGAKGLDLAGTAFAAGSAVADVVVSGSATGAVSLVDTTGMISLGNGLAGDLLLTGLTGSTAAFRLANAGAVTVPAGGTSNIAITGGPAIDVTGTPGASLSFDDVDTTGSTTDGINLAGLGSGTFNAAASSAITDAAEVSFDLDGGSGAVVYPGTITSDVGRLLRVNGTTGGFKTFSGVITDNGDGDGGELGVLLTNNTGATVRLLNSVVVRTTTQPAFTATGGGTVALPSSVGANTLETTTGTPLTVVGTAIDASGLTFRRIASNGAANGIVLNGTGAGRLLVAGSGGACTVAVPTCTGGTIVGSTGAGVSLTNVGSVDLRFVRIADGGDDGIRATTVTDVDLSDVLVTGNGNSHAGGLEERGLDYLNVTGTPQILRTVVSGSDDSNAHLRNTTGTTTLTVDGSTFSGSKHNAGLRLRGEGSSVVNATVRGNVFSLNADPGFSMQTDAATTAVQTLLFDDNDVSGGSPTAAPGRPQVSINAGSASTVKASITNNDIKSATGSELILNTLAGHTGVFDARVTGNDIGDAQPGVLDAPTDAGVGIAGWANGNGTTRMEIRNNTLANWGSQGIALSHVDGSGTASYTVTDNTFGVADSGPNAAEGIYITAGALSTDTGNVCVDLENNTGLHTAGQQGAPDVAMDLFGAATLRFADVNSSDVATVEGSLRAKNPTSPGLTFATYSGLPTATTATGCTLTVGTP